MRVSQKWFISGLLWSFVLLMNSAYGETNLMSNGGFEKGTSGWGFSDAKRCQIDLEVFHWGVQSFKIVGEKGCSLSQWANSSRISINPNKVYRRRCLLCQDSERDREMPCNLFDNHMPSSLFFDSQYIDAKK